MQPVKKRYVILDALRGFALLGICLANYPEFSLYSFLSPEDAAALRTPGLDRVLRGLLAFFVDGKFYTVFSLLFGIGFSIILEHAVQKGAGLRVFYRRMACLLVIGLLHLWFLWSGDILALYAALGMLLPLWRNCSDRGLLRWAGALLLLPVAVDTAVELAQLRPAGWFHDKQWEICGRYGITEENFAYWLRDSDDYKGVLQFLHQGGFERMTEFIDGNRYFRVMGLFLLGYWAGRQKFFVRLEEFRPLLRRIVRAGFALGVYLLEMASSALWMRFFRFGPVEWVWRMLTYGQYLPLRKSE